MDMIRDLEDIGFNGAAGFRPRRRFAEYSFRKAIWLLQWGRGLSPTETISLRTMRASWSSLQWGRGLSPTETSNATQWGCEGVRASMGPRAFAHGDHLSFQ